MNDALANLKILGLDSSEIKLMSVLYGSGRQSIAQTTRSTHLPRMTVHDSMQRLHDRGFVRSVTLGKRTEWKAVDVSKLQSKVNHAFDSIKQAEDSADALQALQQLDAKDVGVHIFRGVHQVKRAYESLLGERTASARVNVIDGAHFFRDYFKYISEHESEMSLAESIRQSGNIFNAIMAESNIGHLKEATLPADIYRAMFETPLDIKTFSDNELPVASEIAIFEQSITIFTPKKQLLMHIKQEEIVALVHALYAQLEQKSSKINTFSLLQTLLGDS